MKDQLRLRKVDVNVVCSICNNTPKTTLHTLVTCSFAGACWEKVSIVTLSGRYNNFTEWVDLVFKQCKADETRT